MFCYHKTTIQPSITSILPTLSLHPVSYTHLDVYKRQTRTCAGTRYAIKTIDTDLTFDKFYRSDTASILSLIHI